MARRTRTGSCRRGSGQRGFSLLGLLFMVAGLGVAMAALGTMWHTAAQREKERDLLFVGSQYRRAIESFWKMPLPVGTVRRLPKNFDELLSDPRFPTPVRHLRRLYRGQHALERAVLAEQQDLVLATEVVVEVARGEVRLFGDFAHPCGGQAAAAERQR